MTAPDGYGAKHGRGDIHDCLDSARGHRRRDRLAAWRYMGLRHWQAILCLLLGFLLAATTAAPAIHHIVTGIVRSLTGH